MNPFAVKRWYKRGSGDIAETINFPAPWYPVRLSVDFASGTGTAALTLTGYNALTSETRETLFTTAVVGTGTDLNLRWAIEELEAGGWTFLPDEGLKLAWTNPDALNMTWTINLRYQSA